MCKIITRQPTAQQIIGAENIHPLLELIYLGRGITNAAELNYNFDQLLPYDKLMDINKAVTLLYESLLLKQRVIIIGDFDTDGATSTALAVRALRLMGLEQVSYLVPNRFDYGYGLSPEIVKFAANKKPDLLVTVDNGIANHTGVDLAKSLGMKVLITDHHLPAKTLPNADAIVNPNQHKDQFTSKNLAGVGVIFYVLLALRKYLREKNWFQERAIPEPNMAQFLDLVALGTIADVVSLDKNNRILVQQGLQRIRSGKTWVGITALLESSSCSYENINSRDLGYLIAPRLNAAGRLDDMTLGIECLLADDYAEARKIAVQLGMLNKERRSLELTMQREAEEALKEFGHISEIPLGFCILKENWHQGVLGVVASRIKERFYRPVIVFTKVSDEELKGSARSITGINIRDVLYNIDKKNPDLIMRFGGHAMAAGISVKPEQYCAFCQAFLNELTACTSMDDLVKNIYIDGSLNLEYLSLETAEILRNAGPWGQGFMDPKFGDKFYITQKKLVGDKHLRMVLSIPNTTVTLNAIAFNAENKPEEINDSAYLIYSLDVNEYRGIKSLQLVVEHIFSI